MGKNHIKRMAAPKTWDTSRRTTKFITKQSPGPHAKELSYPMDVLIKEVLNYASSTREAKKLLNANEIKVDGKRRSDFRFPVGIFDTIQFAGNNFRVVLNRKGKLSLVSIGSEEASIKPCKIIGKTMVNGKIQINLYDGKNILSGDKSCKVGDTLIISLPDHKISKHLKLGKKAFIFLTGGKHIGETGIVEDISGSKIIYKDSNGNLIETSKKYAFVAGDSKPSVTLE